MSWTWWGYYNEFPNLTGYPKKKAKISYVMLMMKLTIINIAIKKKQARRYWITSYSYKQAKSKTYTGV